MTPAHLIADLRARGFRFTLDDGKPKIAPGEKLTAEEKAALTANRADVIAELEWERTCEAILPRIGFAPDSMVSSEYVRTEREARERNDRDL